MKKSILAIIFVFLLPNAGLFAITKHYNINRPKNTKDIEYPHDKWDILEDLGMGILYSFSAGIAAVRGNIPGAIAGTWNGSKKLSKVAKKYQENLQFERELNEKSYHGYEPIEKEYDQCYDTYDRVTK